MIVYEVDRLTPGAVHPARAGQGMQLVLTRESFATPQESGGCR